MATNLLNTRTSGICNAVDRQMIYNAQGLLTNLNTVKGNTTIRNMDFVFDNAAGTLTSRTGMMPQKETFAYDNLYRLTKVTAGSNVMDMNYGTGANTGKGNIYNKTGLGVYEYDSARPHAVTSAANASGLIAAQQQDITYTDFHKVKTISENGYLLDIDYGPDRQRVKSTLKHNNSIKKTVIFAGNYERITKTDTVTHLYYITGGDGLSGIYVKQTKGATTLKDGMYYVHPDHLGSLTVITDASGAIKQKTTFDAWGKRTFVTKDKSLVFDRGFTGHEHLEEFALVNMNGRMYDPLLGRFLSPDPYVQNPLYSQSYNRYSYAGNNPLIFTDPSGEKLKPWHWWVLGLALLDPISAITTATVAAGSVIGTATGVAVSTYATTLANTPILFFGGAIDQNWARGRQLVTNSWRINNGLFYSDPNKDFGEQVWELSSRFSWESFQTTVGYASAQIMNSIGKVTDVEFFAGVTWSINSNAKGTDITGVALGNFIIMNDPYYSTRKNYYRDDKGRLNPTYNHAYMHEYGHTLDSRIFGISYLLAIGIPSFIAHKRNDIYAWTEIRANQHAKKYFERYYGVDWNRRAPNLPPFRNRNPIEDYFPTKKHQ